MNKAKLPDCIKVTDIIDKFKEGATPKTPVEILDAILKNQLGIYASAECGWDENTYTVGKTEYPDHFDREDKRETKQITNYKVNPNRAIYKITIPYLPYQQDQPYQDRFLEDIMLKGQADRPLDPDPDSASVLAQNSGNVAASVKKPVTIDNLYILKKDVQTLINFFNDTRPEKLIIANKVWQECFAYGINISDNQEKYFSQMEIAKEWLGENNKKLGKTPLQEIASLICKNRTRMMIRKSVQVSHNNNTPDHPFYALELEIANECWTKLFSNNENQNPKRGTKYIIRKWLSDEYPDLLEKAINRITLTVNPRPQGGALKI